MTDFYILMIKNFRLYYTVEWRKRNCWNRRWITYLISSRIRCVVKWNLACLRSVTKAHKHSV